MATADVGSGAAFAVDRFAMRWSYWRASRYIVEIFDGADEALAALEAVQGGLVSMGFQTLNWLTLFYEELAPSQSAFPRLVVVTDRNTGSVALVLPLLIQKKKRRTVARFANIGVGGYGGPILGPALPKGQRAIQRIWRSVLRAMPDVDIVRLNRMPAHIGGEFNPLLKCWGIVPARCSGNVAIVHDSVDAYLRERGKKYRKDVERCYRLWEKEGSPRFYRAATSVEAAHVYAILEEQKAARYGASGGKLILDEPAYRAFYERLAVDGSDASIALLFALEAGGGIIATTIGIVHGDTLSILHLGSGGDRWSHLSPGRLMIVEIMKYCVDRGIRRFDFGPDDHPFIRGFVTDDVPLYKLIVARDISSAPRAMYHRVRSRLRTSRFISSAYRLIRGILRGKSGH